MRPSLLLALPYVLFVYLVNEISFFLVHMIVLSECLICILEYTVSSRLIQFYLESLRLMYH